MTIRFSSADIKLFAAASHDTNPLHLSAEYARKTPFGQQVVYGVLGAVACLGAIPLRAGHRLRMLSLEIARPMFLDVDYQIAAYGTSVLLMDGSTKVMEVHFDFFPGAPLSSQWSAPAQAPRADADSPDQSLFVPGFTRRGEYRPNPEAAAALLRRFGVEEASVGTLPIAALLWSSYLAGMELPGERALYFKLALQFADSVPTQALLAWHAKLLSRNKLNLLRSEVRLAIDEAVVAHGEISVFLRPNPVSAALEDLPRSRDLEGKTALVIGASRGLGAAITRALVLHGATVLATYQHSRPEAMQLAGNLAGESGKVVLFQGNASDPEWCRTLHAEYGSLDFLILNACPTVRPMRFESATLGRIHSFLEQAFALVSTPLAVFAGSVEAWTILISSIYVETLPKELSHYVAAKAASEGLLRSAARQYGKPGYLIVRPPKLLTDMTNTPYGTSDAIAPEKIAAALVGRLLAAPPQPGTVEILGA